MKQLQEHYESIGVVKIKLYEEVLEKVNFMVWTDEHQWRYIDGEAEGDVQTMNALWGDSPQFQDGYTVEGRFKDIIRDEECTLEIEGVKFIRGSGKRSSFTFRRYRKACKHT